MTTKTKRARAQGREDAGEAGDSQQVAEATTEHRPSLSPTRLGMLRRCPQQYEYRYVQGLVRPPGVSLLVGTAAHAAVEDDLRAKQDDGELLPAEAVCDIAAGAFEERWVEEPPALTEEELEQGVQTVRGDAKDRAIEHALIYHEQGAPLVEPLGVEEGFQLTIPGMEHLLTGRIDIVDGADDRLVVRDFKTAAKKPGADKIERSVQLTAYGLATQVQHGRAPDAVGLDYAVRTKTKAELVRLEGQREAADYAALLEEMRRADRLLKAGAFMPAPDDAWWCSARFCGYHDICPWGAGGRSKPGS